MRHILLLAALFGCSDPYGAAQQADTIESYEKFISENPNSPKVDLAGMRLEGLYLEKARRDKKLSSYDDYLQRYPKGKMRQKAMDEREAFLLGWAASEDTTEAWIQFLDEYPKAKKRVKRRARQRLNMTKHRGKVLLGQVKMDRVNMAEDPQGPLNGYGFWVDVTNQGKRPITRLDLEIAYLGPSGSPLGKKRWEVVHPGPLHSDHTPMREGFSTPLKPGATRVWEWSDAEPPDHWTKKVTVTPVHIVLKEKK
jgi:hypothetical protein